jgi:hypothetical protein
VKLGVRIVELTLLTVVRNRLSRWAISGRGVGIVAGLFCHSVVIRGDPSSGQDRSGSILGATFSEFADLCGQDGFLLICRAHCARRCGKLIDYFWNCRIAFLVDSCTLGGKVIGKKVKYFQLLEYRAGRPLVRGTGGWVVRTGWNGIQEGLSWAGGIRADHIKPTTRTANIRKLTNTESINRKNALILTERSAGLVRKNVECQHQYLTPLTMSPTPCKGSKGTYNSRAHLSGIATEGGANSTQSVRPGCKSVSAMRSLLVRKFIREVI